MKMNSILSVIAIFSAAPVFAHGVEKMVPADAHNFQIATVGLAQTETSETPPTDPWGCSEGIPCPGTLNYATELAVHVTFDSNDSSVAPALTDGQFLEDSKPSLDAYFDLTDEQIAAIKAKTLNPEAQISFSTSEKQVQIQDPSFEYKCNYDSDTNQKIDDGCVEPALPMITVTRQVLTINFNQ